MSALKVDPRRRRRWWYGLAILGILALVSVFTEGTSRAVVTGSPSGFESSDGNMTVDAANAGDWNCFANGAAAGFASGINTGAGSCSSALLPGNAVAIHPDANNGTNGEVTWKAGQKLDAACPTLSNNSSVPNKDDFTGVASYNELDSANPPNTYLYGAEIRDVANGSSSGNVELNQSSGTTACPISRTAGDRLLAFDFTGGGTVLNFHALTWITPANPTAGGNNGTCNISNHSPPCWGANVITSGSGLTVGGCGTTGNDVEGCSNQSAVAAGDNGIDNTALVPQQFAEFGVNLTKVLGLTGCTAFPQEVWESRTSGSSFTSNPEDIEIEHHQIANCGEVKIIKHTDPRGQSGVFSYTSTLPANSTAGGVACTAGGSSGIQSNGSFCLSDAGNTTSDNTANTVDTGPNVPAGSYSLSEGSQPAGFAFEGLTCSADTVSGSTVTPLSSATNTPVTINLKPNGVVTCTYTNQALGEITIVKHTDPRGVNQLFSYSSTIPNDSSFSLNDKGNTTSDSAANTNDTTNVPVGSYSVTETLPSGWTLEGLHCTATGTGSSGSQQGTTAQANITLAAGGHVTCTYQNKAPSGAILITKTGKDKNCLSSATAISNGVCTGASTADLGGATFSVTGTDLLGNPVNKTGTTLNSTGTACVDGLPWNGSGNAYSVTETAPPTGYSADPNNTNPLTVKVLQNANCGDANIATEAATAGFNDNPLTNLSVSAAAQVPGATQSTITCTNASSQSIGNSPQGPKDPASVTANNLVPGTYTCTVVVDP